MTNLALLVLCIGLGLVLRRSGRLPENAPQVLNAFITNVALPAMIVRVLPEAAVTLQTLAVAAVPWALFGLGIVFFVTVGRYCGWRRDTVGALVLSGGLA
ncbi:MAG: AEC family transporter, partial [Alphaproteobacteria bacterium]